MVLRYSWVLKYAVARVPVATVVFMNLEFVTAHLHLETPWQRANARKFLRAQVTVHI